MAIAAGSDHNLVLRSDGTVWAWGSNRQGMLGNGTVDPLTTPAPVAGVKDGAVALGAGSLNSMAMLADGSVLVWGSNSGSQMGDGVSSLHALPTPVLQPCRFTAMPSSEHRASTSRECHALP